MLLMSVTGIAGIMGAVLTAYIAAHAPAREFDWFLGFAVADLQNLCENSRNSKSPPASEGGRYRRTESPTRRSWLDWKVATRVLVEKR